MNCLDKKFPPHAPSVSHYYLNCDARACLLNDFRVTTIELGLSFHRLTALMCLASENTSSTATKAIIKENSCIA